jgi:hypothetical protein
MHVGSAGGQTPLTRVERENCAEKQSQARGLDSQVRNGTLKTVACRCLSKLPALLEVRFAARRRLSSWEKTYPLQD